MDEVTIGYDQTTLRATLDIGAATRRIAALGSGRSLAAVTERARLLEGIGRLDEALVQANAAVRLARATGSRERAAEARLLHASVMQSRGELAEALVECADVVQEARGSDWVETWPAALQQRGVVHFTMGDFVAAESDFETALELRREADLPREQQASSELALLIARDRREMEARPRRATHPLFG